MTRCSPHANACSPTRKKPSAPAVTARSIRSASDWKTSNAAGKWRTTDHAGGKGKQGKIWTIDASGAFHKGPAFGDYQELRDLIAEREEDFAED